MKSLPLAQPVFAGRASDKPRTAVVLALSCALTLGCEKLIGADFDAARPRSSAALCKSRQPPAPGTLSSAGGDTEIIVVFYAMRYGDVPDATGKPSYLSQGYDLDRSCTDGKNTRACTPPAWIPDETEDGTAGQDNAVGRLLTRQSAVLGQGVLTSETMTESLQSGSHAPLGVLRLRKYSPFLDDDELDVDWFVPLAPNSLANGAFLPKFDGAEPDEWPLDSKYVRGTAADAGLLPEAGADAGAAVLTSEFRDEHAYVVRTQLVAHFPRLMMPFGNVLFESEDVVLTGEIVRGTNDRFWQLQNGLVAGRTKAMLGLMPALTYAIVGVPLCTNDAAYAPIKSFACSALDITLKANAPRGAECDAASFGIGFDTRPAKLGRVVDIGPLPVLCPEATDPARDDCRTPPPVPPDG